MQSKSLIFVLGTLLSTLIFFNSCVVVDRVYFEVLRPADTVINLNVRNVDLVNKHFIANPKPVSNMEYEKWQLDSLVSFESVRAAYNILAESERFEFERVDTTFNQNNSNNSRIELKLVDLKTEVLQEPIRDYYTRLYVSSVMVEYKVAWEILNSNNQTVYQCYYHDTVWVEGAKSSYNSLYDLVDFHKAVNHIVNRCGKQFAQTVSPHWNKTYRYIFTSGNNDFVVAKHYVGSNQWDKAEDLWSRYSDSGNKNLAGKANYNLAVKYEREGILLQALEFAKKSKEIGFAPAVEYIQILQARISNIAIIESQIP